MAFSQKCGCSKREPEPARYTPKSARDNIADPLLYTGEGLGLLLCLGLAIAKYALYDFVTSLTYHY